MQTIGFFRESHVSCWSSNWRPPEDGLLAQESAGGYPKPPMRTYGRSLSTPDTNESMSMVIDFLSSWHVLLLRGRGARVERESEENKREHLEEEEEEGGGGMSEETREQT